MEGGKEVGRERERERKTEDGSHLHVGEQEEDERKVHLSLRILQAFGKPVVPEV